MDYQWGEIDRVSKGFPRTRGDRPDSGLAAYWDSALGSPAHAGIDRPLSEPVGERTGVVPPHTRG